MNSFIRLRWRISFSVPLLLILLYARAVPAQEPELNLLLVEVRLDQALLSSAMPAYDLNSHTLLPLGELSRLLGLAIQTRPDQGTASGYILTENRSFSLNLNDARVSRAGVNEAFDPDQIVAEPDDLYVSIFLLERWLPVELDVERSSLILRVTPLETLPLQAQLQRLSAAERMGRQTSGNAVDYPHTDLPYRLWSPPFIDQSLLSEYRRQSDGSVQVRGRYTAHMTGDLLGMESAIYIGQGSEGQAPDLRVTLGRHDPDGGLLGRLRAQTAQFGSLSTVSVENIARGITGQGVHVSNRPLTRPTQFDRQSFEGDLTPGWDVELFFNDALIAFQRPNAEGLYRFEDLPLSYGRNDFELVFHGPLGETRSERYSYSLAESMVLPGEFQYNLFEHRDDDGLTRSIAQFDLGIIRSLSATAGFVRAPVDGVERQYVTGGLRTFWRTFSLSADVANDINGGSLVQLGAKTSVAGVTLDGSRIYVKDFYSELFSNPVDPAITRDALRLGGSIPISPRINLPLTIEFLRSEHDSGRIDKDFSARVSAYAFHTVLTNTLNWRSHNGNKAANGMLGISRRFRDMSLRGQFNYELGTDARMSTVAVSADTFYGDGYRLTMGIAHDLAMPETRYSAGFTKSLGQIGVGAGASYTDTGEIAFSLQLFVGLGRDSAGSDWLFSARPLASTGAASVRAFLDNNNDGVMNSGDDPVSGVGFTVNGGRHQARTGADGLAHLDQLPVKQRMSLGINTATLEDPRWAPVIAGRSLIPRPGKTAEINFPLWMSTEIDGTVYLYEDGVERGMGGLELELLDESDAVVARTTSSWDGFYIIPKVFAGEYWLQISPAQLQRLGLKGTGIRVLTVAGDGEFINGVDLLVVGPPKPTLKKEKSPHG